MQRDLFHNFKDAANYAKTQAKELGFTVKILRCDDGWVVADIESPQAKKKSNEPNDVRYPEYSNDNWKRIEEQRKFEKQEREQTLREYQDQKAYEEAVNSNIPRYRETECEACGRPVSFCRCAG